MGDKKNQLSSPLSLTKFMELAIGSFGIVEVDNGPYSFKESDLSIHVLRPPSLLGTIFEVSSVSQPRYIYIYAALS